jgi:tripartite-type tricarboxylate transporter receptor subunit TctC
MPMSRFRIVELALARVVLAFRGALAQESCSNGAQIDFVVFAVAGNSYDMFARMIGRYLPKHIPQAAAIHNS